MIQLLSTFLKSFILRIILNFILLTSKIKIYGENNIKVIKNNNLPMLMCVWHGRLLFPCIWSKVKKNKPWIIASNHYDAQVIVNIFKKWKFKIIRGSSRKDGEKVTQQMMNIFENKQDNWVGVTNDGPTGPVNIAKPGSIIAAVKSKANIVSITGTADKSWKFNSWDTFMLPKPFSTIIIHISKPLKIDKSDIVNHVTQYMNNAQREADKLINHDIH